MTGDAFQPFADARRILLAVSGGPDSMALLHLALDWSRVSGIPIEAASVDHGLRPAAADECAQVAQWCRALGVAHHSLTWTGEKPATRIQERARAARYALLFEQARAINAEVVLTAHHADDQAETVLYRLVRGSGMAGLAGMASVSWREGLRLGRPLLAYPKADLIDLCRERGQAFVEDPSNADPRYARVRMRRLLPLLAAEGLKPEDLARLASRAARAEEALAAAHARLLAGMELKREPDSLTCDLGPLRAEPLEHLVRLLLSDVGRLSRATPRLDRTEYLAGRIAAALRHGHALKATLGGTLVRLSRKGELVLSPERARQRGTGRSTALHVTV